MESQCLILGSGAAGCSAAIYAARAGMDPLMITGGEPGGQLTVSMEVENYPGFPEKIEGPWLMDRMRAQAANVGTRLVEDVITNVNLSKRPFICTGESGREYTGKTLIIATGGRARWLDRESEEKCSGLGVSASATCDGFFYKGTDVAGIGGGNTALEEALYLSKIAKSVTIIHRRDAFRGEKVMHKRVKETPNISVAWNRVVEEFLGQSDPMPGLTGLRLKDTQNGETEEINVDGAFVAIGHKPNTTLFEDKLNLDRGYIVTEPGSTRTSVAGVFAAGDVQDPVYKQAVTAAGTGCMACLDAEKFLGAQ